MINRDVIERAATWIADQQCKLWESEQPISLASRRSLYLERARAFLTEKLAEGPYDRIYVYLPDDVRPSFIWPEDLAVKLRAIWESESV